jgi:hypothetical protein
MWLISRHGFVSVVQDRDNEDVLLVRGRFREDVASYGYPVEHTPVADYPWRSWIPRAHLAEVVYLAVDGIDYDNFKDEVAREQGPGRAGIYHWVWEVLLHLEEQPGSRA